MNSHSELMDMVATDAVEKYRNQEKRRTTTLAVIIGPLGDFINALPALAAIRKKHGSVELCTELRLMGLAMLAGVADSYKQFAPQNRAMEWCKRYYSGFEDVYSFLGPTFMPGMTMHRIPAKNTGKPYAQHLLDAFKLEGDPVPRLVLNAPVTDSNAIAFHARFDRPPVWPHWQALAVELKKRSPVFQVCGPYEPLPPLGADTARNRPLGELALKLAGCSSFVAADSGPGHLCAALGLPGVSLGADAVWTIRRERVKTLSLRATVPEVLSALMDIDATKAH